MKLLIIVALLVFVIATGVTMFFTGTFKLITSRNRPPGEPTEASQTTAEGGAQEDAQVGATESTSQTDEAQKNKSAEDMEAELRAKLEDYKAQIAAAEAKLAAIRAEIDSLNKAKESISRSQQLAKLYSSMKPDSAAAILSKLEEPLSIKILTEMDDRSAGKIMDALATANPSYCAKISKLMVNNDKS